MIPQLRKHQTYLRIIYAVTVAYMVLTECEVLPRQFLGTTPSTQYALDFASIVLALGGTFFACKLFDFKRVKSDLESNASQWERHYFKWDARRLLILAGSIWGCTFIYFASFNSNTSHYGLLIVLVGSIFCWSSQREMSRLQKQKKP